MKHVIQLTALFCVAMISAPVWAQEKLSLEEAVLQGRKFSPQSLPMLQWKADEDAYTYLKDGDMWSGKPGKTADMKYLTVAELNNALKTDWKSFPAHQWVEQNILAIESESFWKYNAEKKDGYKWFTPAEDQSNHTAHLKSEKMAYTKAHNLFVTAAGKETQITKEKEGIVSGQSVSRNEYGINGGIFWSPDGSKLAFYQKDESAVSDYPLPDYSVRPAVSKTIKYPMAGDKSEKIRVGIWDAQTGSTVFLKFDSNSDDFYATNLTWNPEGTKVLVQWLNRATNWMKMMLFDAATGKMEKVLFEEKDERWVEPLFPSHFLPNNSSLFVHISDRDGFNNLYVYDLTGNLLRKSKATFEITEFLGFDKKGDNAYVMATGEFPTEELCYRISMADMVLNKVTSSHGVHECKVAGSGNYVLDRYTSLADPGKIDLLGKDGITQKNLLTPQNPAVTKKMGKAEIFAIPLTDDTDGWCRIIKPSDFDPAKKYPVVVYVYGGPHAQMVTNNFWGGASLWMYQLAEEGYIIFTLDNRGSAHRGKKFQQVIHRNLGTNELADQLKGVEWLKSQPWVDATRMAIHGWSFGGFMTTTMMLKSPGTFKVGVAGGPVIDWSMYEVMYGERYMDTPAENPEGYKNSDLTNYVNKLEGKLLMIHGVEDDVVVMQHNLKFLKAAVDNGKQVDFFAYPGHAHNVSGKDRLHLMTKVIDYIKINLK